MVCFLFILELRLVDLFVQFQEMIFLMVMVLESKRRENKLE